jgi:DNA-binding NtrC family response regulator
MSLFNLSQRRLAAAIGRLAYANPFLPERIETERQILGERFASAANVWSVARIDGDGLHNHRQISQLTAELVDDARQRLADGVTFDERDLQLYSDAVLYHLFDRCREELQVMIEAAHAGRTATHAAFWREFCVAVESHYAPGGRTLPGGYNPAHMLACYFQLRRAFFHVFYFIVGRSPAAARLRAAVWQSIFTHDLRRYQRTLYRHLGDVTTLITGASGTGKELVARAIGLSRYVPFDADQGRFLENFAAGFTPVNLSALSPTLIESELFGHRRGAFTGAIADRVGWLEACSPHGAVFLDEIGEVDPAVQVKLLRVLQTRTFERLGDTTNRTFTGKILAATNRDLASEMRAGRFREDFYYRLCADRIQTPTLREQLDECPDDLEDLLLVSARRVAPEEAAALASETAVWIKEHLGSRYRWPGNVRELEQCFRNVMIHGEYRPAKRAADPDEGWRGTAAALQDGSLSADELLRRYCRIVYDQCGSYEDTARRLGLDRRTVKSKLQPPRESNPPQSRPLAGD